MTVSTFAASVSMTYYSNDGLYANARAGDELSAQYDYTHPLGQSFGPNYRVYQVGAIWPTSSLPDTDVVSLARASLYVATLSSGMYPTIKCYDKKISQNTSDWVPGANLAALAISNSVVLNNASTQFWFTLTNNAVVDKVSSTSFLFADYAQETGSPPGGVAYDFVYSYQLGGSPYSPMLEVTHAPPPPTAPRMMV